jgi:hypothetical protein
MGCIIEPFSFTEYKVKTLKRVTSSIRGRYLASIAAGLGLLSCGAAGAADLPLAPSNSPSPELGAHSIDLEPSPAWLGASTPKPLEDKSLPVILAWPTPQDVTPGDLETPVLATVDNCSLASCLRGSTPAAELETASALPTGSVSPAPEIAQAADGADSNQAALAKGIPKPHCQFDFSAVAKQYELWGGQFDRTSNILNVQPVIPVPLSENLTLVNRTIVPIAYQPELAADLDSAFGLGDINYTGFFVPATTGNFTWGVGPSILLPTATDTVLGTGKWSVGPAAVGLVTEGPIVAGGLVSQLWSFAGDSDRVNVSLFTFQPFFNYNFDGGWYLTTSPIITANWAASSEQWTVPLGGGGGRVFNIGSQPVNVNAQVFWNAVRPEGAASWSLRAQLTLLFP